MSYFRRKKDYSELNYKVMCGKCGRLLPSSELENGFCIRCREREKIEKKIIEFWNREDNELVERIRKINIDLKLFNCPYCGKNFVIYHAHFDRPDISLAVLDNPSNMNEKYVCKNWRCNATGNSLDDMTQRINTFVKIINKFWRLKKEN